MFCKYCGKEIDDKASVCVHCGLPTDNYYYERQASTQPVRKQENLLAIIGFILSFFIPVAGLVCSIIGYRRATKCGYEGKNLALAGIIISCILIAIIILIVLFCVLFLLGLLTIAAAWGAA